LHNEIGEGLRISIDAIESFLAILACDAVASARSLPVFKCSATVE